MPFLSKFQKKIFYCSILEYSNLLNFLCIQGFNISFESSFSDNANGQNLFKKLHKGVMQQYRHVIWTSKLTFAKNHILSCVVISVLSLLLQTVELCNH